MTAQAHELATKSALIRSALVAHQPWIEEHLGVPLADVVIFDGLKNFSQIGLDKVFDFAALKASHSPESRRFRTFVASANTPSACPAYVRVETPTRRWAQPTCAFRRKAGGYSRPEWCIAV